MDKTSQKWKDEEEKGSAGESRGLIAFTFTIFLAFYMGTAVAQWLRCCAANREVTGSIPVSISGFFIDIKSFRSHHGPGVDSASNRNDYQEHFSWGKGGRCVRLTTLPPSCAVVMKSGNLNFLEPSGPLQACNGTALPSVLQTEKLLSFHSSASYTTKTGYRSAVLSLKTVQNL